MADVALFAIWVGTLALFLLVGAITLADGVYSVVTGRPGFLPFERIFRHRVPATETDCVRYGAGRILMVLGLLLGIGPSVLAGLNSFFQTAVSIQQGPFGRLALLILMAGCFVAGIACLLASVVVVARVRYSPTENMQLT